MRKILAVLALLALLSSCGDFFNSKNSGKATVSIHFGNSLSAKALSRTIVPDLVSAVAGGSYRVTLDSATLPSKVRTVINADSISFLDVEAGSWNVTVEALDEGGQVVAITPAPPARIALEVVAGALPQKGANPALDVNYVEMPPFEPGSAPGNGNLSLGLLIKTQDVATSIRVDYALLDSSDATVLADHGSGPVPVSATLPQFDTFTSSPPYYDGNYLWCLNTLSEADIPAGKYSLQLLFYSAAGNTLIGVYRESVNVYAYVTSDKWIQAPTKAGDLPVLVSELTIKSSELQKTLSQLAGIALFDPATMQADYITPSFSPETLSYDLTSPITGLRSISFMAAESLPGQTISYSWNGTSYGQLPSGVASKELQLIPGNNVLRVTCLAPNGDTNLETMYVITIPCEPTVVPKMVYVRGGTFNNGAANVTLSDYLIGAYDVTQAQYFSVMGTNPSQFQDPVDLNRPVEKVSFYDAMVFCNQLSFMEGLTPVYSINGSTDPASWGAVPTTNDASIIPWNAAIMIRNATGYRLPTEAEWEYAARGGSQSQGYIYAGSDNLDEVGWYNDSMTHAVGQKAPNELWLYDMSGNVFNWCWDWSGSLSTSDQLDPTGPSYNYSHVTRGGSWLVGAQQAQLSYRNQTAPPWTRDFCWGFRVVRANIGYDGRVGVTVSLPIEAVSLSSSPQYLSLSSQTDVLVTATSDASRTYTYAWLLDGSVTGYSDATFTITQAWLQLLYTTADVGTTHELLCIASDTLDASKIWSVRYVFTLVN